MSRNSVMSRIDTLKEWIPTTKIYKEKKAKELAASRRQDLRRHER